MGLNVSVVVPTYKRGKLLRNCLESLLKQDFPDNQYEIIVVEDGSHEGLKIVDSMPNNRVPIRYFRASHGGHASTYNFGLEKARNEIVAFIDDDAKAPPNWLSEMTRVLLETRDRGVAGVGGRISSDYPNDDLEVRLSARGDLLWTGFDAVVFGLRDVESLPGANMAFWRCALLDIGGFDKRFSKTMSWRHETDVSVRVRSKGHRLVFDSDLVVLHRAARWGDRLERIRPLVVWSMVRDDAYFRAKNFGWRGLLGAVFSAVRDARTRLTVSIVNLLLVFVHIIAWMPGAALGLLQSNQSTMPGEAKNEITPRIRWR